MRILLVEDDDLLAEALVKALTDQRYVINVATDGQEGWELVEALHLTCSARCDATKAQWHKALPAVATHR